MINLKEQMICADLSERTGLSATEPSHSAQQAVPRRQFIHPLPYTITSQQSKQPQSSQPSTKRQFILPFPSATQHTSLPSAQLSFPLPASQRAKPPLSIVQPSFLAPVSSVAVLEPLL